MIQKFWKRILVLDCEESDWEISTLTLSDQDFAFCFIEEIYRTVPSSNLGQIIFEIFIESNWNYNKTIEITDIQTISIKIMIIIVLKITYPKSIVFITSFITFRDLNTKTIVAEVFFDIKIFYHFVKREK